MMKKTLFFLSLLLCVFAMLRGEWAKTLHVGLFDDPGELMPTADGGYIFSVNSHNSSTRSFSWLVKYDSNHEVEWQRSYTAGYNLELNGTTPTSDGGYILTGSCTPGDNTGAELLVMKLVPDGRIEWQRLYGGDFNDGGVTIRQTGDGGYVVGGYSYSWDPWQTRYPSPWIIKLSETGAVEWQFRYPAGWMVRQIEELSNGGFIVLNAGQDMNSFIFMELDSTGGVEWVLEPSSGQGLFNLDGFIDSNDGGYLAVGGIYDAIGLSDLWIVKLNGSGEILWQRAYGDLRNNWGDSIRKTPDGAYVALGTNVISGMQQEDLWIVKLQADWNIDWEKSYGGYDTEWNGSILPLNDGSLMVLGETASWRETESGSDAWLLHLSENGEIADCPFIRDTNSIFLTTSITVEKSSRTPFPTDCTVREHTIETEPLSHSEKLICPCTPPTSFDLLTPPTGASNIPLDAFLDWEDSPNAQSYDVYFGSNPQSPRVATVQESRYEPGPLAPCTTYYWRIIATNPCGTASSTASNFTTAGCVQYRLTMESGPGGRTDPPAGDHYFSAGCEITVQAIPDSGYELSEWTGDIGGNNPASRELAIFLDGDKVIQASFNPKPATSRNRFFLDIDWDDAGEIEKSMGVSGDIPVSGDWDGDGLTNYGVYRPDRNMFFLDTNWDGYADIMQAFGLPGDIPIIGDWDGDGISDFGVYRPSRSKFYLDTDRDGLADLSLAFGIRNDIPIVGDWDGDGVWNVGVYRPGRCAFFLDTDWNSFADIRISYGRKDDIAVSGDWDGDGTTNIGIYRPGSSRFFLDTDWDQFGNFVVAYGIIGDLPICGDWNGDDKTNYGIFRR